MKVPLWFGQTYLIGMALLCASAGGYLIYTHHDAAGVVIGVSACLLSVYIGRVVLNR